jgi:hypothetical protein
MAVRSQAEPGNEEVNVIVQRLLGFDPASFF